MIGRADIERSKSNVALNAWLPQASYPCGNFSDTSSWTFFRPEGSIGHAFTVCTHTENQNQLSFSPFGRYEISVLIERAMCTQGKDVICTIVVVVVVVRRPLVRACSGRPHKEKDSPLCVHGIKGFPTKMSTDQATICGMKYLPMYNVHKEGSPPPSLPSRLCG